MLSVAEKYIRDLNADANPHLFGQDWNDEAWAVCKSDMLIKGEDADNIVLGDTFTKDGFDRDAERQEAHFRLHARQPALRRGVEAAAEATSSRSATRSATTAASAPDCRASTTARCSSCSTCSRRCAHPRRAAAASRIVFNGSPLFTGDAGSGESNIRQWIIENDWLEAIVALPDQLFYNTGISTYIWVLTNRKEPQRKGKVQLIDARRFFVKMRKSLGNKRNKIGDPDERRAGPDRRDQRASTATSRTARRAASRSTASEKSARRQQGLRQR